MGHGQDPLEDKKYGFGMTALWVRPVSYLSLNKTFHLFSFNIIDSPDEKTILPPLFQPVDLFFIVRPGKAGGSGKKKLLGPLCEKI